MDYGLIGEKLGHSFSKEIHESFARYGYSLKELNTSELERFMNERPFKGINVTIPYKQTVIPYLDCVSETAKKIGAVNTVVNVNGKLYGYNTDYYGFNYLLYKSGIEIKGKTVAILGSGGASKMANCALVDLGAKRVITVSRKGEINYQNLSTCKNIQVIVNASPVGMYPNNGECLVDLTSFPNLEGVVDMVYNPYTTELLRRANALGVKTANGLPMLVAQAKRACELFTDKLLDDSIIDQTVNKIKSQTLNLVLVGMPGSGKTTLGKELSAFLGKEFIDVDQEFSNIHGISAGEYIKRNGETAFRNAESNLLSDLLKQSRKVIATGGGAVIREENRINMRSNSIVVWVQRSLTDLPDDGRPLSKEYGVEKLYEQRRPLYDSVCDIAVKNDGKIDKVVKNLLDRLEEYLRGVKNEN